ncbi:MAG: class I SAM-dependent methyltransferase [Gaiellaceae bacterium]
MSRRDTTRALGRHFARFVTDVVVPRPVLWRVFRPLVRRQFDSLAPEWNAMRGGDTFAAYERALAAVPTPPRRALDLGTGTGIGAFAIARRFPAADVVGADLSERMIDEARRLAPPDLRARVRFDVADASKLPYEDGAFDLVALANMIPFFDELERVVARGGRVLVFFSSGPSTPIYVSDERLRAELERRGFAEFADFTDGAGTALLARNQATA